MAEIEVRFDAFIAAVTRDEEGDAHRRLDDRRGRDHDVWTFRRDLKSRDPNWLLVETDEAA